MNITSSVHLADMLSPVSMYLRLRDQFPGSVLLESSDYHTAENSKSFLACSIASEFKYKANGELEIRQPDGTEEKRIIEFQQLLHELKQYSDQFSDSNAPEGVGLFGYTAYDAIQEFDDVKLKYQIQPDAVLAHYKAFHYVLRIDHFNDSMEVFSISYTGEEPKQFPLSLLNDLPVAVYPFKTVKEVKVEPSEERFLEMVATAKEHCQRGDVFQMVISREFSQEFSGDDFNVYRSLRSINPSPYLFYFDCGDKRLFGSSPEAQLIIQSGEAEIHPIAGTFKRTGNDAEDAKQAEELLKDPKENAEHTMLVDLARNDLNRHCKQVHVDILKEIQFFSHVIHLVSKVKGTLAEQTNSGMWDLVADTFPAGTLSGAPKIKAMECISALEHKSRNWYGGAIGVVGFNGNFNHAIMIRTFESQNNTLNFRAGAGVVNASDPKKELQEVTNKLMALSKALKAAEEVVI